MQRSTLVILITAVIIVIMAGLGYVLFWPKESVNKDNLNGNFILNTVKSLRNSSTSEVNSNKWKTYKNKSIGIEFKYPASWGELGKWNQGDKIKDGKLYTTFTLNLVDLSHLDHVYPDCDDEPINKQWEKVKCIKNDLVDIECQERINENGVKYVWRVERTLGVPFYEALVPTGKYILSFNFQDEENYKKRAKEYQKLLSTLKILK